VPARDVEQLGADLRRHGQERDRHDNAERPDGEPHLQRIGQCADNVGSYTVIGTINDANYQGSATNTLVISNAIRPQMSLALVERT